MPPRLLDDVQGNILKGFNKPYAWLIFFKFYDPANTTQARRWLGRLSSAHYHDLPTIPSTADLIRSSEEINSRRSVDTDYQPKETHLHIAFTKHGIEAMGLTVPPSKGVYTGRGMESRIKSQNLDKDGDPFYLGMKNRTAQMGDFLQSRSQLWKEPFRSSTIDILLIIAYDDQAEGEEKSEKLKKQAENNGLASYPNVEKGSAIIRNNKQFEHFGFRDGISQPLIKGIDEKYISQRTIYKDEFCPEDFILSGLVGNLEWANNGSFMALRILRQDVQAFWNFMSSTGPKFGLTKDELAAKFCGRWRGGASLTKNPDDPPGNDFIFGKDDDRGERTPRFSHIRKVNPRDLNEDINNHRILRRGIPYGPEWQEGDPDSSNKERGLLFICYQRDLQEQFEHIQSRWANVENFPFQVIENTQMHGPDPIAGQHFEDNPVTFFHDGTMTEIKIQQWVTVRGGEYFFSPSLSALRGLDS